MKKSELKNIIKKEINRLKEQRMRTPGPAMPSMGTSGQKPSVSSMPSAACLAAINSAASMSNNGQLNENIFKRFKGALHKIFTNCGSQYDMSGGPV